MQHGPLSCPPTALSFLKEERRGLISTYHFECRMCGVQRTITSEPSYTEEAATANFAATMGAMSAGGGHALLGEVTWALDIPAMSKPTFAKYQNKVAEAWEKLALKVMEDAAKEEARLAKEANEVDANGCPCIVVVVDGSWTKRSYRTKYNPLSGMAAIMGYRTKKVLFLGVRNKFCTTCCRAEKKGVPATKHRCGKNWEGPSTAMEADIILEGFMASQEMYGLKYTKFIGDGDSSVFKVLYESMPYGTQKIQKIECRNHIVKNYTNRIINEIGSVKGKDRSTSKDRAYVRNQVRRLRAAVVGAITYRKSEDGPLSDQVKKLAADILNGPYHVFGDHTKCATYFCNGSNEGVFNQVETLSSDVFQEVMKAVNIDAEHASSLIYDCDSNVVEHLNSIVAKMVGGKRINYCMGISYQARCEGAVVSVNTGGKLHSTTYMEGCKRSPGVYTKKAEDRKRRQNEKRQEWRALTKRQRSSLMASADEHYGPNAQKPSTSGYDSAEVARRELFLKSLQRTPEELQKLEAATHKQSGSDLWIEERKRLLMASNFGKIMNMRPSTDPNNKVKEILNIFPETSAMKYGRSMEGMARKAFENKLGVKVGKCGLFVDVRKPFLGATPDGREGDDDILEIKCPASAMDTNSVREAVQEKVITCLETEKETGEMKMKPKNNYYYQVQGQLHITGKRHCYFVVWTPNDMFIQVIEKDDELCIKMIDKLEAFYMNYLLPALVKKFPPRR